MRTNGGQLTEITSLIDAGIIRPVVDRIFPFASTKEAMAYVEAGRARGKVVSAHGFWASHFSIAKPTEGHWSLAFEGG
jgi:hypothetical protein